MSEPVNCDLLQAQYLEEMEDVRQSRDTNGRITAEGLWHMKRAAEIQYELSKATEGYISSWHMQMGRRLAEAALVYKNRLGISTISPPQNENNRPNTGGKTSAEKVSNEKKQSNGELEGFRLQDYIVTPGDVSLESARQGNPEVVDALKMAVYDDFPKLFPDIEDYTDLRVPHRLLYGPPGSGKSYICKGLSTYLSEMYPAGQSCFFLIPCSEIMSKYVGTAEHRIREVFNAAAGYQFSIICIDEVDSICPPRSSDQKTNYTTTLLELIDGVQGKTKSMVILATNHPDNVDSALISRIGNRDFVDYAKKDALEKVLRSHLAILSGLGETEEERERMIRQLATRAEERHFSFRNMNVLCDEIMKALKRKLREKYPEGCKGMKAFLPLSADELMQAAEAVSTDFNQEEYNRLLEYRNAHRS